MTPHPIRAGGRCPFTTAQHRPDPALGVVRGVGPAGPVGLSIRGVLDYIGPGVRVDWVDQSWGGAKTLWAVNSDVQGSVLIRGRQLDGPHEVRFNDPAVKELALTPKTGAFPGGWRDYPSFTRIRTPGCYAYQVDTASGTAVVVVFRAKGPQVGI